MKRDYGVAILLLTLIAVPSCGGGSEPALQDGAGEVLGNGRNVILITLDGLRQDHMSLFGYERETTPNIDALAATGVTFDEIIPTSGSTKASLTSLLTGLDYRYHHLFHYRQKLPEDFYTLAEAYRDAGYLTMAVTGTPILGKVLNYDQGFDVYEDFARQPNSADYVRGDRIGEKILGFLDRVAGNDVQAPFFVYAHFEEPHPPWFPPSPWLDGDKDAYETQPFGVGCTYIPEPEEFAGISGADRAEWIAKYDGAIRQADDQIGLIVARLREHGLLENTVIAVSTDHGYELLDRFAFGHGFSVFEEIVKTFLVLHDGSGAEHEIAPGRHQGRLFDVGPTLLGMCGIDPPEFWEGIDLLRDPEFLPAYAFSYDNGVVSIRSKEYKLMHVDFGDQRPKPAAIEEFGFMLFDLEADPGETRDVKDEHRKIFQDMVAEYDAYLGDLDGEFVLGTTMPLGEATEERLRALGYIQ